ncbi:MAG: DUF1846 domain-containing protein [Christensenellaceae bacterium]|jgi:uncharacterized protein (UPF0371 family)
MKPIGFDNQKYLHMQSQHIIERIEQLGGKLYLEFGGKLFDDYHASRVLPGFEPDSKVKMLLQLKEQAEIVIVINAADIEKNRLRNDLGITYDSEVMRLIDAFRSIGLYVGSVVITQYNGQASADAYRALLEDRGVKVYRHYNIEGYPSNIPLIISEEGYGKNDFIETERSLVVITAPGPGSGKMATCLSQLYHEHMRGQLAGYAKFETFPIWNIPLQHPVNLAYEAATADLDDVNMIDPFHLEKYGVTTVNYNRDVEIFPVLDAIFNRITDGNSPYHSPTDMGVNMAGYCIIDDAITREASKQEIIRRYYHTASLKQKGQATEAMVSKIKILMQQAEVSAENRPVVAAALGKEEATNAPAAAIMLENGKLLTGKTSDLLGATSALLLNTLKELAGIADEVLLISPTVIEPIQKLKTTNLGNKNPRLHTDETLIALSISAASDSVAASALAELPKLRGLEFHSSVILSAVDESVLRKLGVNVTCEPRYQTNRLYQL